MKTLDKGQDKIQKICNVLRIETLEPAKREAEEIIAQAKQEKDRILEAAAREAEQMIQGARTSVEQEKRVFKSSLEQAGRQGVEGLRQEVERKLFNDQLNEVVAKQMSEPKVVASLIKAIIAALEKDGLATDLTAIIPKAVSPQAVITELGEGIVKKLKGGTVQLGHFAGGAKVKLEDKKMTLDISDEALREILAQYVRKDFRQFIFST